MCVRVCVCVCVCVLYVFTVYQSTEYPLCLMHNQIQHSTHTACITVTSITLSLYIARGMHSMSTLVNLGATLH